MKDDNQQDNLIEPCFAWIETFIGKKFYPLNPDPRSIDIRDIAHSLALKTRYNGQCQNFYSIAQHSVYVAKLIMENWESPVLRLQALLHDAAEAYLQDIPRPLKHTPQMQFYRDAENNLQQIIFQRFNLDPELDPTIKEADYEMFARESSTPKIMIRRFHWSVPERSPLPDFYSWTPKQAEATFLRLFTGLEAKAARVRASLAKMNPVRK